MGIEDLMKKDKSTKMFDLLVETVDNWANPKQDFGLIS